MNLLSISDFPCNGLLPPHAHDSHHETLVILDGRIEVETRGQRVAGDAGSVLVYPRGAWHTERAVSGELAMIFFAWTCADDETEASISDCPRIVCDRRNRIRMLSSWMLDLSRLQSASHTGSIPDILKLIVREYYDVATGSNTSDEMAAAIQSYIQAHISERITLDDLARVACLSKYRFAHIFEQITQMPPMRFVRQMRFEAARTLLMNTNLTQRAIAEAVGFRDEIQLNRIVSKQIGASPGSLRVGSRRNLLNSNGLDEAKRD